MREKDGRRAGRIWAWAGLAIVLIGAFAGIGYLVGEDVVPQNSQYLAPADANATAAADTGAIPSFVGGNGSDNAAQSIYAAPLPPDFAPANAPVNSVIDDSDQAPAVSDRAEPSTPDALPGDPAAASTNGYDH